MPETPLSPSEIRLKRLRYQSWHRGCKETDLIFGPFSDVELPKLHAAELDDYEALLQEADADIWNWITGKTLPPISRYDTLLARLKNYGLCQ